MEVEKSACSTGHSIKHEVYMVKEGDEMKRLVRDPRWLHAIVVSRLSSDGLCFGRDGSHVTVM